MNSTSEIWHLTSNVSNQGYEGPSQDSETQNEYPVHIKILKPTSK